MGIGEVLIAAQEIYEIIQTCIDIIKLIKEEEDSINNALNILKEVSEGPLVDSLREVAETILKNTIQLVDLTRMFLDGLLKIVEDTSKADEEGAALLKEALAMI